MNLERLRQEADRQVHEGRNRVVLRIQEQEREFIVRRVADRVFLLPANWGLSEDALGAALEKALDALAKEGADVDGLSSDQPFLILPAKHILQRDPSGKLQDHLAGDHLKNHVIFLHEDLPRIVHKLNRKLSGSGDVFLSVLLSHELRHEATGRSGAEVEEDFAFLDSLRLIGLVSIRNINLTRFAKLLAKMHFTPPLLVQKRPMGIRLRAFMARCRFEIWNLFGNSLNRVNRNGFLAGTVLGMLSTSLIFFITSPTQHPFSPESMLYLLPIVAFAGIVPVIRMSHFVHEVGHYLFGKSVGANVQLKSVKKY